MPAAVAAAAAVDEPAELAADATATCTEVSFAIWHPNQSLSLANALCLASLTTAVQGHTATKFYQICHKPNAQPRTWPEDETDTDADTDTDAPPAKHWHRFLHQPCSQAFSRDTSAISEPLWH